MTPVQNNEAQSQSEWQGRWTWIIFEKAVRTERLDTRPA
jgi:hypothetical protein